MQCLSCTRVSSWLIFNGSPWVGNWDNVFVENTCIFAAEEPRHLLCAKNKATISNVLKGCHAFELFNSYFLNLVTEREKTWSLTAVNVWLPAMKWCSRVLLFSVIKKKNPKPAVWIERFLKKVILMSPTIYFVVTPCFSCCQTATGGVFIRIKKKMPWGKKKDLNCIIFNWEDVRIELGFLVVFCCCIN